MESGAYEVSLVRLSAKAWVQFLKLRIKILMKLGQEPWGLFHKTLQIRKLRIYSYGQILTVNLLINCQNSVIYGHFVVNYEEKSFMEQAPGLIVLGGGSCSDGRGFESRHCILDGHDIFHIDLL